MTRFTTIDQWLAHLEQRHVKSTEKDLARVAAVRDRLGLRFAVPVISVAGTNGKGSTCAMLESIARHAGWRTGLYIKPHLVHFTERCRIDGEPVPAAALLPHFEAVEAARAGTPLSWFEFTTLAILRLLAQAPLDVAILEVGLGGRLDAVNVIDADCAVITAVDFDHMAYLGTDRESIGWEKAHIMRAGRPAIVADPAPPASLVEFGQRLGADLWLAGRDFQCRGDRQQWSWSGRGRRYAGLAYPALRGANQLLNASGAIAALEALRERLPVGAQAIRSGLARVELAGRFQILPGRPAVVLDVAHNVQSVAALAASLDAMGFYPRTRAVFGAMKDKDIAGLVPKIAPLVDAWHCCDLPTPRAARAAELAALVRATPAAHGRSVEVHEHAGPAEALAAALAAADPADRIVVFGSFYTVGGVMKSGLPRLAARHVPERGRAGAAS
ncbi:MAG: bifunctional tetrahydrofolate synthase/dihydrofolate synthase [Comamonadaceae bacterium]|nr:bifunctional tetrahydrofolate synthase/dihydrofolate synthase [Rubrivivax sp.]NLZ41297.1 bifunctional tetrahydrofolate synthase/dihydrofolate synthase [Comamonadaceae bacterium]